MTYEEASKRVGYTVDALRGFVREGRIKTRAGRLPPPFYREMLLRQDVEKIGSTMSGGGRHWVSGDE
ncbi:MAG: hypothetical protein DLM70_11505 [Chloroflexi bacterium]|nr:MAG: hypothetical protein DLM70_11505 [Chloroflexota bacterium]